MHGKYLTCKHFPLHASFLMYVHINLYLSFPRDCSKILKSFISCKCCRNKVYPRLYGIRSFVSVSPKNQSHV